ncbi:MAG: PAS domain S-box protein [Desulfocapsaceae bacterium]|nr:PAS domain S-box protein [Desulfocapsaceae bacterium]
MYDMNAATENPEPTLRPCAFNTLPTGIAVPVKYRIALFLAIVAAGLAANFLNVSLFLDIRFIFGSIFAMLALQLFGPGWGTLAAAIIAAPLCLPWSHLFLCIVPTAETATVGWLMSRHRVGMVTADTLFWLIIGTPLALLFHYLVMPVTLSNTDIIKQAINGLANALIARLIFTGFILCSRSAPTSLKDLICNLLSFFLLCPVLTMLTAESRSDLDETTRNIHITLIQTAEDINHFLQTWLGNRKIAIVHLAELAVSASPQQMEPSLELAVKTDINNFKRIGLLNTEATITALYPPVDEKGQNCINKTLTGHLFVTELRQTLKPMISEVVMDRIARPGPMVAMLAPVTAKGQYTGSIAGVLGLEEIRALLDKASNHNAMFYTLIDRNGSVIMSNRPDQTVMTPFTKTPGTIKYLESDISQWTPVLPPNASPYERWTKSFYVSETSLGALSEWKLILELPVAPFQKMLSDNYTGKLSLLFLILICALALAELASHWLLVTFERLCLVTRDLPAKLGHEQGIIWPDSTISEAKNLIDNFREMADILSLKFNEIRHINANLEQRVKERTAKLKEGEERYRSILDASPDSITITDMEGRIGMVSPMGASMFGLDGQMIGAGQLITDFIVPEDRERALANIPARIHGAMPSPHEYRGLRRDGTTFDIEVNRDFIRGADGQAAAIVFVIRDITNRKRIEAENALLEERNRQLQKNESLGRMAGAIAHTFNNLLTAVMGNLDIALEDLPPDSELAVCLQHAMKATYRAAEVSSLMRTYLGQTTGKQVPVDLAAICRQSLQQVPISVLNTAVVKTNFPNPGPTVKANAEQVQHILTNLLTNSLEAMGEGKGAIEVTVKRVVTANIPSRHRFPFDWQPETPSYACLEVRDEGCGIPEADIDTLFDPFFTTKFTGRGLGLPVVLGILKAHAGAIVVESAPGRGTLLQVFFPCT